MDINCSQKVVRKMKPTAKKNIVLMSECSFSGGTWDGLVKSIDMTPLFESFQHPDEIQEEEYKKGNHLLMGK